MDATVIKVYGEGEWRVRRHGYSKRRTWRKLHVGVDAASDAIFALAITANDFCDEQLLPELMDQLDAHIAQVSGDGAYDLRDCFQAIDARKARAAIPSRRAYLTAWQLLMEALLGLDENLRCIRRFDTQF